MPVQANDWLYAVRTLRRSPRFTLAAALTLALGIGANTAIFSFINTVYLRPLPYPQPDRLVSLWESNSRGRGNGASAASYLAWRDDPLFASVSAWGWDVVTLSGGPWPERVQVQRVTSDYFQTLGIQPQVGRTFLAAEDRAGADCVLLVSGRLWHNWFGADRDFAGKAVQVDGAACRIIGLMPKGFLPPISASTSVDAWMPLKLDAARIANRSDRGLSVLARLSPGVTLDQAQHRLDSESQQLATGWKARVDLLKTRIVGRTNQGLMALAGAVGFLLLIACINVAMLLAARGAGQRREIAIRAALGASRGRLIRHLLAQTILLAALGGAGGLAISYWSMGALVALAEGVLPRLNEATVDWRVLAFTAGLSVLTGVLFGLAPAIGISRANLREALPAARRRPILRHTQIAAEIAIAFILLAGAGLLMRSFRAIHAVDLGFRTEHVLSANFALPPTHYATPQRYLRFLGDVLASVRRVPGVLTATVTLGVPMRGSAGGKFEIFGRPPDPAEKLEAEFRPADPAYFATLGMTLDRGRSIDASDLDGAPPVTLVNQKLARDFLGGNPIGQQIRVAGKGRELPWMTIVGVVRDTRHIGPLRDGFAEIYIPYAQFRSTDLQPRALIVRTAGDPERIVPALQRAVAGVDKDQPLVAVRSMERSLAEFIAPQRFDTTVMAIFAAIGLALTAVGIFGVMSYRVAWRTHEIGVRMALGAERANVLRMVVAEAMGAAVVGLALGWAGAWALTRYLASLLFHVKPGDPVTLVSGSLVALAAAAIASYLPARRASQLDPMSALREE
jgi:putative ABC transport system permease protein